MIVFVASYVLILVIVIALAGGAVEVVRFYRRLQKWRKSFPRARIVTYDIEGDYSTRYMVEVRGDWFGGWRALNLSEPAERDKREMPRGVHEYTGDERKWYIFHYMTTNYDSAVSHSRKWLDAKEREEYPSWRRTGVQEVD